MASEISKSRFAALLTPDLRVDKDSIWAAQSSYTQQSPTAGVPEPQGNYEITLRASGDQDAASQLQFLCRKPGLPGTCGFVWRNVGDTYYRGWEPPHALSYWEAPEWVDGSGVVALAASPQVRALASGKVALCYMRRLTAESTIPNAYVQIRDTDGTWSGVNVFAGQPNAALGCCLVEIESRLMLFAWSENVATDVAQIRMYYSEDDGATWSLGSSGCLETAISTDASTGYTLGRIRGAYANGQVLLVGHLIDNGSPTAVTDVLIQWASSDLGATFTEIVRGDGDDADYQGAYPEVIAVNGKFQIYYVAEGSTAKSVIRSEISSAYYSYLFGLSGTTDIQGSISSIRAAIDDAGTPETITSTDLAVAHDNNNIWVYVRAFNADSRTVCLYSANGGTDFSAVGAATGSSTRGYIVRTGDSSTYINEFAATYNRGQVLLAHQWTADPGDEESSVGVAYLGGYSTVTLPPIEDNQDIRDRATWDYSWLPLDIPSDVAAWTNLGAATQELTGGYLSIISTVSTARSYYRDPTGTVSGGMLVRARLQVDVADGTPIASDRIAVRVRLADSTDDYDVSVRFTTAAIRCYDNNAAAAIGSDITVDTTGGVEVLIAIARSSFRLWYRIPSDATDREWSVGPQTDSLTSDTGTPDSTNRVRFGHQVTGVSETRWYEVHSTADASNYLTGVPEYVLARGQTNPDDLYAKLASATPDYFADGVSISVIDGPGFFGDDFRVNTRYRYPIENIFHGVAASPRVGWRSVDDTADETIAIRLSSETSVEQSPGNDVIGFGFFGCNWRTATIYGRNSGGSWVEIGNVDSATGLSSLRFQGYSSAVEPSSTAGSTPYVHTNEFEGCTFRAASDSDLYRITGNTEGKWSTAGQKSPTLFLATPVGSSSGTAGSIWATNFVHLIWLNGAKYSAYRIVIDAQDTVDGDLRIGTLIVGYLNVFGTDYSWGRTITTEAGAELTIARDRTSQSRVVAPPARAWEFAWTDGIDQSQVEDDVNSPDWIEASDTGSAEAVASTQDIAYQMEGLVAQLDGAHTPVVYIPRFDRDTEDDMQITLTRRKQLILSRIVSPARIEVIQGDELLDEVVRVATVEGQEVV